MENYVTTDVLNDRMFEKLHKREFEKYYERLESICNHAKTTVDVAYPAMKYQLEQGIRGMASQADIAEKADKEYVNVILERLNKLEERVKFELEEHPDISDEDNESKGENVIKEEDDEESDDNEPTKKSKPKKMPTMNSALDTPITMPEQKKQP